MNQAQQLAGQMAQDGVIEVDVQPEIQPELGSEISLNIRDESNRNFFQNSMETELQVTLENTVQSITDEEIIVSYTQSTEYTDWENVQKLHESGVFSTLILTRNNLTLYTTETNSNKKTQIARIEWITAESNQHAYIHWITVSKSYRRCKIGFNIRQTVLNSLRKNPNITVVLSEAFSKEGKRLMKKQDFNPITQNDTLTSIDDLGKNWYYKKV